MKQQQVTIFRSMRYGLRPMVFYSLYQAVGNAVVGFKCLPIPLLLNIVSYLPLFDDELVVGKLARTVNPVLVDFLKKSTGAVPLPWQFYIKSVINIKRDLIVKLKSEDLVYQPCGLFYPYQFLRRSNHLDVRQWLVNNAPPYYSFFYHSRCDWVISRLFYLSMGWVFATVAASLFTSMLVEFPDDQLSVGCNSSRVHRALLACKPSYVVFAIDDCNRRPGCVQPLQGIVAAHGALQAASALCYFYKGLPYLKGVASMMLFFLGGCRIYCFTPGVYVRFSTQFKLRVHRVNNRLDRLERRLFLIEHRTLRPKIESEHPPGCRYV